MIMILYFCNSIRYIKTIQNKIFLAIILCFWKLNCTNHICIKVNAIQQYIDINWVHIHIDTNSNTL